MFHLETTMLGLALASDAAVVSFAIGLLGTDLHLAHLVGRGIVASLFFGFFQFLMSWLGSMGGHGLSFSAYGHFFQLVVSFVFMTLGIKLIQESFDKEHKKISWGIGPLLTLSIVTSIDALAAGVSLGTLPFPYMAALEIGLVTFGVCLLAYFSTRIVNKIPHQWLLRFAAMVFLYLGVENILKHFF